MPAQAATVTKLDTTTLANGAGDWSSAPGTTDTCSYFTGSTITFANSINQTLGGDLSIGILDTSQGGKPPILIKADGNTLTLNANNTAANASSGSTICSIDQRGSNTDVTMINCPITLAENSIFRVSMGGFPAINGAIDDGGGAKSLTITAATSNGQPGTTSLSASNSYSGGTFIGFNSASGTMVTLSGSATLGASGSDDAGIAPTVSEDATYLIFTYNRTDAANDDSNTSIEVEYGSDLTGWTTAQDTVDGVIINETPGSPADVVEVKMPKTLAVGSKLFARLKVVIAP